MTEDQKEEPEGGQPPAGAIVRYTPLESIVKREPQPSLLSPQDLLQQVGLGSQLEQRLFQERQEGCFFVFPQSVLGMDQVYAAPNKHGIAYVYFAPYDEEKKRFTTIPQFVFHSGIAFGDPIDIVTIPLPDPAIMEELFLTFPPDQYQALVNFYRNFSEKGKVNAIYRDNREDSKAIINPPGYLCFSYQMKSGDHIGLEMSNLFFNDITVYHNGVRVQRHDPKVDIVHGDLIRIGPSIVFGYVEKEKIVAKKISVDNPAQSGRELAVVESTGKEKKP